MQSKHPPAPFTSKGRHNKQERLAKYIPNFVELEVTADISKLAQIAVKKPLISVFTGQNVIIERYVEVVANS